MQKRPIVLILDSLFADLSLEAETANAFGWDLERWDGDSSSLKRANAVVHVKTRIDGDFMAQLERCSVIGRFGTGLDSIDQKEAARRGIEIASVRDYCTQELTTHSLGLAFALDRRLTAFNTGEISSQETWQNIAAANALPGRTQAAVIGAGTIGSAVTRALLGAGLEVHLVSSHGSPELIEAGARNASMAEALAVADMIFLHMAAPHDGKPVVTDDWLSLVKPTAILVNTARLALFDEHAVARALSEGRLAGLGLDALVSTSSPLLDLSRSSHVIITPHIGWYSARSASVLRKAGVENTLKAAYGQDGNLKVI